MQCTAAIRKYCTFLEFDGGAPARSAAHWCSPPPAAAAAPPRRHQQPPEEEVVLSEVHMESRRPAPGCRAATTFTDGAGQAVVSVQHSMATPLRAVGLQVWRGALLLADLVVHRGAAAFGGATALELGAGSGLAGVVLSRFASTVYLTGESPFTFSLGSRPRCSRCPGIAASIAAWGSTPPTCGRCRIPLALQTQGLTCWQTALPTLGTTRSSMAVRQETAAAASRQHSLPHPRCWCGSSTG